MKDFLVTGPVASGKVKHVRDSIDATNRPSFTLNLGAQFANVLQEDFLSDAVQTENAIILLDEFDRADETVQKTLVDIIESRQMGSIEVAKDVQFVVVAKAGASVVVKKLERDELRAELARI